MRRWMAMAGAFLALYWTVSPVLACVVPNGGMTPQEQACCQHMHEMCGSPQMPQSHSCCKTEVRPGNTIVVTNDHPTQSALQIVAAISASVGPPHSAESPVGSHNSVDTGPPLTISVLRI